VDELIRFYVVNKRRPEAAVRLRDELREARRLIALVPDGGVPYPRPYPALAWLGFKWINVRIYWIGWHNDANGPIITNVLHVRADIEGRATPDTSDPNEW
jgi:plasmid stabilization system protein ParE